MSVVASVAMFVAAGVAVPAAAQDREYNVSGVVLDTAGKPIEGATVELRERASRRAFKTTSNAEGRFRQAGLPHGVYEVSIRRAGYQLRAEEWDLSEPQSERMKKVEVGPYTLLSDAQVAEGERNARLKELLEQASRQVREQDCAAALATVGEMLAVTPDDANALYLRGLCEVRGERIPAATASFRRVTELNPSFAAAHLNLAVCLERSGDVAGALASYDATLALEPGNVAALYNAGVLHYNASRVAQALPYFARAIEAAPQDDRALEMAAYCELQLERLEAAEHHLEQARAAATEPSRAAALAELLAAVRKRLAEPAGAPR